MITIKEYPEQRAELFSPLDELIGSVNENELIFVQSQICEKGLKGYYIMFNNKKINILSDGYLETWPSKFFDDRALNYMKLSRHMNRTRDLKKKKIKK